MTMSVNQIKIDIIKRGYTIVEKQNQEGNLEINCIKTDTDGLVFQVSQYFLFNLLNDDEEYIGILKQFVRTIDEAMADRHYQNINSCNHQPVMIGSKKSCMKCLGKFGDRIILDINSN